MDASSRQFWAGVVFTVILVAFLWRAFSHKGPLARLHYIIIQFVCALCAGMAGASFTGVALFNMEYASEGGKLAFQGTAGVALFALTLVLFAKLVNADTIDANAPLPPAPPPPPPPGKWISPGLGTPFQQVAETLADEAGASIDLSQLTLAERSLVPRSQRLACGTLEEAKKSLIKLASLVPVGQMRNYIVRLDEPNKHFLLDLIS